MLSKRIGCWITGGTLIGLGALAAAASGFSIYEQDAKASAMAGAWTARADNASANWYNPAAMVRQGASFQVGINAITIGMGSTLTSTAPFGGAPAGTEFEPESSVATPAHLYYLQRVGKRIAWGFGINTPYGLSTEWTQPVSFSAKKSKLLTFVFNPNVALAFGDHWAVGFGVDYIHADIKDFSRDIPPPTPGTQNLTGDGTDWGFNIAMHYDSDAFKVGASFRQNLSPEIEGSLVTNVPVDLSFPGKTTLNLPEQAAIGFAYTGARSWQIEFDVSWARWSRFEALDIELQGAPDIMIPEKWDDTHALRLGASWDLALRHQLRFGVLRDTNPIPDETMRPSIPDADRWSLTLGYGYAGAKIDVDFYYMGLFFDNRTVPANPLDPSVVPGKYESFSNLLGVTVGWRFGGGS